MTTGLRKYLGLLAIPLLALSVIAQPAAAFPLGAPTLQAAPQPTAQPDLLTVGARYCNAYVHTNCLVGHSYRQQQNDDAAAAIFLGTLGVLALSAPYWGGHHHGYYGGGYDGGYYGHRGYGGYHRRHHGW